MPSLQTFSERNCEHIVQANKITKPIPLGLISPLEFQQSTQCIYE